MNAMTEAQSTTVLYAALRAELGIVLRTNDPMKARATLYHQRKLLGDIELAPIMIRVSPDDSEHLLWIIRRDRVPSIDLAQV